MKQHASTAVDQLYCACVEPPPIQPPRQTPTIQRCPAPPLLPSRSRHTKSSSSLGSEISQRKKSLASPDAAVSPAPRRAEIVGAQGKVNTAVFFKKLCVPLVSIKFPVKDVLFRQGEAADAVFYIGSGRIHRIITTEKGHERLVAILGPEDFCGEECLTAQPLHTTSALVVEEAEIVRIGKGTMSRLLRNSPIFAEKFTAFLLSRYLKTEAALVNQLVGSVEQRLRRVLWTLANTGKNGPSVVPNIKQEMLAALVGTTRPRVNYFLTKFRKLGLLEYGSPLPAGSIKVHASLQYGSAQIDLDSD